MKFNALPDNFVNKSYSKNPVFLFLRTTSESKVKKKDCKFWVLLSTASFEGLFWKVFNETSIIEFIFRFSFQILS